MNSLTRKFTLPLSLLMLLMLFLSLISITFGQTEYYFDVIAQTGQSVPEGGHIESLGWYPSINDAGHVAFTAIIDDGRHAVFVDNGRMLEERSLLANSFFFALGTKVSDLNINFDFGKVVQINNEGQVVWIAIPRLDLFFPSFILRQGRISSDFKLVAKTHYDRIDRPDPVSKSPFWNFYPWVTISNRVDNKSRVVFSAIPRYNESHTILATPVDTENGGHDNQADYHFSGNLSGFPNLYPMISDNGLTLVKAGDKPAGDLILFVDENLKSAQLVAGQDEYFAVGHRSGISDDGRLIAFMGHHKNQGVGIFAKPGPSSLIKIAGMSKDGILDPGEEWNDTGEDVGPFHQFENMSPFWISTRVGVNRTEIESKNHYTIAYLANCTIEPTTGDRIPLGLYVSHVDITNPLSPQVSAPILVVKVGAQIDGLSGTVTRIDLCDPVNNNSQIAFWVSTTEGQAIIRVEKLFEVIVKCDTETEGDKQIVPGDKIKITITLENTTSKTLRIDEITLSSDLLQKDYTVSQAITVGPGETTTFSPIEAMIVDETAKDAENKLITEDVLNPKPGYLSFEDKIKMYVWYTLDETPKLQCSLESLKNEYGDIWNLTYPDFQIIGSPSATEDELNYYQNGDSGYSHTQDLLVRKYAIKAARYQSETDNWPKKPEEGEFWEFPDNPSVVIENVYKYADDLLDPNNYPNNLYPDATILQWAEDGHIDVDIGSNDLHPNYGNGEIEWGDFLKKKYPKIVYQFSHHRGHICIEHAYLFTSFARTLGFYSREINVALGNGHRWVYQEAAAQVWYEKNWHYYDLYMGLIDIKFSDDYIYDEKWASYDVGHAFNTQTDRNWVVDEISGWDSSQWKRLWKRLADGVLVVAHSPVSVLYTDSSGRGIGTIGTLIPDDYPTRENPIPLTRSGSINEIPISLYFPPGSTGFEDESDPDSVIDINETIFIPSEEITDVQNFSLIFEGTDTGTYGLEIMSAGETTETLISLNGNIAKDEIVEIKFISDFTGDTPIVNVESHSPSIVHTPLISPQLPGVVISAIIKDADDDLDISSLKLYYSSDSGSTWECLPMDSTGMPDEYAASIPESILGTVHYYITASDRKLNTTTHPDYEPMVNSHEIIVKLNNFYAVTVNLVAGLNMFSVPLNDARISRLSDLANFIGDEVTMIISYDTAAKKFVTYMPTFPEASPANVLVKGGVGYIMMMKKAKDVTFQGLPWISDISLSVGINLISIPVNPGSWRLSDLANFIGTEVTMIISYDTTTKKFVTYMPTFPEASPANVVVRGGVGYIVMMKKAKDVTFIGEVWDMPAIVAYPASLITPQNVTTTPVLVVESMICREDTSMELNSMKVTTRNLSVKQTATDSKSANVASGRYITTLVDLSDSYAAKVGDVFEVNVFDTTGTFSENSLRYTVTQQDIQSGIMSLDIMLSPIPKENALVANYPNPFNPDTWIPYKLKKESEVTILIYNIAGQMVKTIHLGRKDAGFYLTKAKAAYWDGRDSLGEKVSSGVYFYTLQAGDFAATRKMVLVK